MFSEKSCPYACRACRHIALSEAESLTQKVTFLKTKLSRWPESLADIHSVHGAQRLGYRNKVCLHTAYSEGRWHFGLIARREFTAIPHCPVHTPAVNAITEHLSLLLPPPELFPLCFFVQSGRQIMLVVKSGVMPDTDWFSDNLVSFLLSQKIEGFWLHLNPSAGHKVFMKNNFFLLWGESVSADTYGLLYGPMSFQQLIPELYADSVNWAAAYFNTGRDSLVVDLYSGTGYTCRQWHGAGALTMGVELNGEAVSCFMQNNPGVPVLRGTCANRLPQLDTFIQQNSKPDTCLYANPPRTGIEPEVIKWITGRYRPKRTAYLSCSPGTLARDLNMLEGGGYKVDSIIPYDFFPQTIHVECLALLRLNT